MEPPALIYVGMGALMARIMLDGTITKEYNWLGWLKFLVKIASITLLWPLMLFVEKLQHWLGHDGEDGHHGH
jgi:hypothetical protein